MCAAVCHVTLCIIATVNSAERRENRIHRFIRKGRRFRKSTNSRMQHVGYGLCEQQNEDEQRLDLVVFPYLELCRSEGLGRGIHCGSHDPVTHYEPLQSCSAEFVAPPPRPEQPFFQRSIAAMAVQPDILRQLE